MAVWQPNKFLKKEAQQLDIDNIDYVTPTTHWICDELGKN